MSIGNDDTGGLSAYLYGQLPVTFKYHKVDEAFNRHFLGYISAALMIVSGSLSGGYNEEKLDFSAGAARAIKRLIMFLPLPEV